MAFSWLFLFAIKSRAMQSDEAPSWNSTTCHASQCKIISTWGAFLWAHRSCRIALFPFSKPQNSQWTCHISTNEYRAPFDNERQFHRRRARNRWRLDPPTFWQAMDSQLTLNLWLSTQISLPNHSWLTKNCSSDSHFSTHLWVWWWVYGLHIYASHCKLSTKMTHTQIQLRYFVFFFKISEAIWYPKQARLCIVKATVVLYPSILREIFQAHYMSEVAVWAPTPLETLCQLAKDTNNSCKRTLKFRMRSFSLL